MLPCKAFGGLTGPPKLLLGNFTKCYKSDDYYYSLEPRKQRKRTGGWKEILQESRKLLLQRPYSSKKFQVSGSNSGVSQEASKQVMSQPRTQTILSSLSRTQFQVHSRARSTLPPWGPGPGWNLETRKLRLGPKTLYLWGMATHRPRGKTFQLHGAGAWWKFPGLPWSPASPRITPPSRGPPAL